METEHNPNEPLDFDPLSAIACVIAVGVLVVGLLVVTYVACKHLPGPAGPDQPEPPVWQTNVIVLGTNHVTVIRSNHVIVTTTPAPMMAQVRSFLLPSTTGIEASLCRSNALDADLYCRFAVITAPSLSGPWATNIVHAWRTPSGFLFRNNDQTGGNYDRIEIPGPTNGFIRILP